MSGKKEKEARRRQRELARRLVDAGVPTRPLSDTLLDFGGPVFRRLQEPTAEQLEKTASFVVAIWNAHVKALPVWGEPGELEGLSARAREAGEPAVLAMVEELAGRRRAFADDPRLVTGFTARPRPDGRGFDLTCEGTVPARLLGHPP